MKKIVGLTLALMLVIGVAAAWAAEVEGKIQSVDTSQRTIVLDDGTTLSVAEGVVMEDLKEGATVKASYEERDGKKVATSVTVSQ
jgi:hypothetical protein